MPSLLVTNDFPPKVGGIQSYLHELWRRLPPDETTVLTTPYAGTDEWDAAQPFRVERTRERIAVPDTRAGAAHRRARDRGRGRRDLPRPDAPARPHRAAPQGRALRRRDPRRRDHGARSPARARARWRGACSAARAASSPRASTRRPRPCTRRDSRSRRSSCRPASIPIGSVRSTPTTRAAARAGFGLPDDAAVVLGCEPARAPQGLRRADRRGRRARRPGAARDRWRRARRARLERTRPARRQADRTRFLGRVPDEELARALRQRATCSRCCAATAGAGSRPRGSASCSSRRPRAAVPSVAGRSRAGRTRRSSTARPASSSSPATRRGPSRARPDPRGDASVGAVMGDAARERVERELSYDRLVERLLPLTRGDLRGARRHGLAGTLAHRADERPRRGGDGYPGAERGSCVMAQPLVGSRIIVAAWAGNVLFAATSSPSRSAPTRLRGRVDRDVPRPVRGVARRVDVGVRARVWPAPRGATTSSCRACSSCRARRRARCAGTCSARSPSRS